jgi:hypothetical protein
MEYNTGRSNNTPNNDLEYFVNTLEHHDQDYDPGINGTFLNSLDPMFYATRMQNPDVLTNAQTKRQVDADKFVDAQHPEIERLQEIETFEYIPKSKIPPKQIFGLNMDI